MNCKRRLITWIITFSTAMGLLSSVAYANYSNDLCDIGMDNKDQSMLIIDEESEIDDEFSQRMLVITQNGKDYLNYANSNKVMGSPVYLYNLDEQLEAFFYPLWASGYIVVSYKDGHVIEYSPYNLPVALQRLSSNETIYYNGPLTFCIKEDNQFVNIVSNEVISRNSDYYKYSVPYTRNIAIKNYASDTMNTATRSSLLPSPENYVSATEGWYCTITGISNILEYYKEEFSADTYCAGVSSVATLRSILNSGHYIHNAPLNLDSAAGLHLRGEYTGLRSYLNRSDVADYSVTVTSTTHTKVKTQINSYSRPVLLTIYTTSINSNSDPTSTHIVLCYGYNETAMTTYYIVNNGWGHNNIQVCADDIPSSFKMMYLS